VSLQIIKDMKALYVHQTEDVDESVL